MSMIWLLQPVLETSGNFFSELSELEEKDQKYEDKGVSEEAGLRNILNSDDDDDEEEERDKEDDHDAEYEEGNGKKDKMLDEKS